MAHVKTSPYYPQSYGKIERFHRTIKQECIRPKTPLALEDAQRVVGHYINEYNTVRLHSALGYVTHQDMNLVSARQLPAPQYSCWTFAASVWLDWNLGVVVRAGSTA